MAELRPLLGELAKLTQKPAAVAGADTAAAEGGSGGQMTAEEAEALSGAPEEITRMLQEEASRRMQELQMSLAQRVKSSEARFIRRMRKMKLS
ncbi:hypothetical protein [Azorhizobium oxalatiphilum]|nr:hypothetical protein [Azorhizobium oxalatiphilum]